MAKPPKKTVTQMAMNSIVTGSGRLETVSGLRSASRLELRAIALEHHDDVLDGTADAAGKVAGAKGRHHRVFDDQPRMQVGERAFETVADLDPHLSIALRDEQQNAVVLARLAKAPGAEQPVGVGLDGLAAEALDGCDDDLVRGFALERLQPLRSTRLPPQRR